MDAAGRGWMLRTQSRAANQWRLVIMISAGDGLPKTMIPLVPAGELVAADHDEDVVGCFAAGMVTPSAAGKPGLFEVPAGSAFSLGHAFPQERLMVRAAQPP